jgi:Alpha-kinase family
MPDMNMGDDDSSAPLRVASAPSNYDEEEDEVMDIKVKSQDTLIRERFNRAQAAGNIHSIPSSSIRATFQSISSAVTSMRNGASRKPLQERQIVMEKNGARSQMRSFPATRMVLKPNGTGLQNAAGEKSNQRIVQISTQPFAQGGLRNVFRMKEGGQAGKVGKESRHEIDDKERCKFHVETSLCQARAAEYAEKFNREVTRNRFAGVGTIKVLCAEVYRLKDPDFPRGYRYLHVEEEIHGKYEKYNSNNGYVLESDAPECEVAQAFR